jgi:uncharacterized protein YeeX (DUF496 family)
MKEMTENDDIIDFIEECEEDDAEDYIKEFENISKENSEINKNITKPSEDSKRQKFDSADYMMKHSKASARKTNN